MRRDSLERLYEVERGVRPFEGRVQKFEPRPQLVAARPDLQIVLTGSSHALDRLGRGDISGLEAVGAPQETISSRTYFDTERNLLAVRGFKLLLEETPEGRLQKIERVEPFTGLIGVNCMETKLRPADIFPAPCGEIEFDAALQGATSALIVRERTEKRETSQRLLVKDAEIECRTVVVTSTNASNEETTSFAVLSLSAGDKNAFFEAVRSIVKETKLAPGPLSAIDDPTVLASGQAVGRQAKYNVTLTDEPFAILQSIIRRAAERLIHLRPIFLETQDPEALKQIRVAIRRFRVAERIYRPYLEDDSLKKIARKGRSFSRTLGAARDWDVFVEETLPAFGAEGYASDGFDRLKARAEELREAHWEGAVRCVAGRKFSVFLLRMLAAAEETAPESLAPDALDGDLKRFARAVFEERLEAAKSVATALDQRYLEERHPLRIALKKLRYTVQIFRALYPKEARSPYMKEMSYLQDAFGETNDAATANALAVEAARGQGPEAMKAAGFLSGEAAPRAQLAAASVDDAWRAFEAKTPFWRLEQDINAQY